jgi:hypothetical protein
MTADETEIHDFLRQFPNLYVSVLEVSKRLGNRGRYDRDRTWARPILRRMEMDGIVESNAFGEYRLICQKGDTQFFKDALQSPGSVALGDTTIIMLDDKGAQ